MLMPAVADAFDLEDSLRQLHVQHRQAEQPDLRLAQGGGMTLDRPSSRCAGAVTWIGS